jgi:hypothetical protein
MTRRKSYGNIRYNPLLFIAGALLIIALLKSTAGRITEANTITANWNMQDLDIATNGNILRALLLLEIKPAPPPETPTPSSILRKPSDYYGKYLQLYGTIKSAKSYTPDNNLENLLIGSSSELIIIAGDGATILDCFLLGLNSTPTPETLITVYGYCPGIRYIQNAQGGITSELVLIGQLGTLSSKTTDHASAQTSNAYFPLSQSPITSINPSP